MKSTTDYSIFKEYNSNREIDQKHVRRLIAAIRERNLLSVNPILVDKFMRVIDGQHRLAAAKELGVEIFYLEGDSLDRKDISKLNSNQKNWKTLDYINFYTLERLEAFVKFSHMINKYPMISLSALLILCSSESSRNLPELQNGFLDVGSLMEATEVCDFLISLNEKYSMKFVFDSRFPLAMKQASCAEGFDLKVFEDHVEGNPRAMVQCHTKKQYLAMIEEIYNRGLSKNRISLV